MATKTSRLINSTDQLQASMGAIQSDLNFSTIESFVDDAEMKQIIPAIGYGLYDRLRADDLTDKESRALMLLQKAVTNFAIHYFVAFGSLQISDKGIFVVKGNSSLPASDKKTYQLRVQSRADGFTALETAVNYLEDNIPDFPAYQADRAHQFNRRFYINTTADFNFAYDINNNFEVFNRLKSVMATIEENYIDPVLGTSVSQALHTAILNKSTTAIQDSLLVRIAKAVSPLTIAEAIPYRLFDLDATGLVTATIKNNAENVEINTEADMGRLQITMNAAHARGESEVAKLTKWLNENAAQLATYTPVDLDAMTFTNDPDSGIVFVQ
jgi:hypothetical protein